MLGHLKTLLQPFLFYTDIIFSLYIYISSCDKNCNNSFAYLSSVSFQSDVGFVFGQQLSDRVVSASSGNAVEPDSLTQEKTKDENTGEKKYLIKQSFHIVFP